MKRKEEGGRVIYTIEKTNSQRPEVQVATSSAETSSAHKYSNNHRNYGTENNGHKKGIMACIVLCWMWVF
jgi:hypothetical protein